VLVPKSHLPKAISQPVHHFGIFFGCKNNHITICKRLFLGLAAVDSFVQNKDLVSPVNGVLLIGFDDKIWHTFGI
jgi:hypothetical protein